MTAPTTTQITIPAGEERAELFAALQDLDHAAQVFKPREKAAAYNRAIAAFDAIRERISNEKAMEKVPADVVERIRDAIAARPQYVAIAIDIDDLNAILAAVDAAGAAQ